MASTPAASNRFKMAGLISGLDTEALVKQMALATKNKINKQQQKLDLLSWKQTNYRSVIDKISTYKNTYFNGLKPETNVKSNYLMSAYKAVSSNNKISVTASSSSNGSTYDISRIEQLAEKAVVESSSAASTGILLDFSKAEANKDYDLTVTIDGLKKDITFKAGRTIEQTNENLQLVLQDQFNDTNIKVSNNVVSYQANDGISHNVTLKVTEGKLENAEEDYKKQDETETAIGIQGTVSNKISLNSKLKNIAFKEPVAGGSFAFTINGVGFTFDKESTVKQIIDKVNTSSAGVTISIDTLSQKFKIESKDEGVGGAIKVEQTNGNLLSALFGKDVIATKGNMSSGVLINQNITGKEVAGSEKSPTDFTSFTNKQFNVTVNGVTKTIGLWGYDSNGIKLNYADKVTEDKTTPGTVQVCDTLNNELKAAFGAYAPKFTYDSETKQMTIVGDIGDIVSVSETKVDKNGKVVYGEDANAEGVETLKGSSEFIKALGYENNVTNEITNETKLASIFGLGAEDNDIVFTINGTTMDITAETTIEDFNNAFGTDASFSLNTGIITLNKPLTVSGTKADALVKNVFKTDAGIVADPDSYISSGASRLNAWGKNAILTVNGTVITNTTNQVNIDGTTINLEHATPDMIGVTFTGEDVINISTQRDTTKAFDAVVKFVNDYNKLIEDLQIEVKTRRPTDNGLLTGTKFDPLTDEQKEEMSEDEIKNWEEKAKQGLLYNDPEVNKFLSKVRTGFMTTTADGFGLYDMGITVSLDYKQNGKLIINESKLKAAFEDNPDKIQELFTGAEGLPARVETAIDNAVSNQATSLGSLVRIAGIANTSTQADNTISKEITTYADLIKNLKVKYEKETERYWKQFTNLENVMNKYNSQSSWITQQFGGGA